MAAPSGKSAFDGKIASPRGDTLSEAIIHAKLEAGAVIPELWIRRLQEVSGNVKFVEPTEKLLERLDAFLDWIVKWHNHLPEEAMVPVCKYLCLVIHQDCTAIYFNKDAQKKAGIVCARWGMIPGAHDPDDKICMHYYTAARYIEEAMVLHEFPVKFRGYTNGNPDRPLRSRAVYRDATRYYLALDYMLRTGNRPNLDQFEDPDSKRPTYRGFETRAEETPGNEEGAPDEDDTRYRQNVHGDLVVTPSPTHPFFGVGKPMDGIAYRKEESGKFSACFNPDRKEARQYGLYFGHGRFEVGKWWPMNLAFIFDGIHDTPFFRVAGDLTRGTYSLIVTPRSETLDFGDIIYFAPLPARTNLKLDGTMADEGPGFLKKSIETGRPVRVIRGAQKGRGPAGYAPAFGYRYDGLYSVKSFEETEDEHVGWYELFVLVRLPDQQSLEWSMARVTVEEQQEAMQRCRERYPGTRREDQDVEMKDA